MKPLKLIAQRFFDDCGVCSLAMYAEITWEQAAALLEYKSENGVATDVIFRVLWTLGYDVHWLEETMPTRKAIVVVKSKNFFDKQHCIYFDGKNYIDPTRGVAYEHNDDVRENIVGTIEMSDG